MKKLLPLILIVLAVLIFFFFIDPEFDKVKKLSQEREDNETLLELADKLQRKREDLHTAFNSIGVGEREELERLLPDTVDNVRLVLDINNVAEQYGIVIKNITVTRDGEREESSRQNVVSSVDTTGDIGTITLGFTIDATYDIFISFMKDLEEALRVVDIKALEISANPQDDTFLSFNITLDTYWLR